MFFDNLSRRRSLQDPSDPTYSLNRIVENPRDLKKIIDVHNMNKFIQIPTSDIRFEELSLLVQSEYKGRKVGDLVTEGSLHHGRKPQLETQRGHDQTGPDRPGDRPTHRHWIGEERETRRQFTLTTRLARDFGPSPRLGDTSRG